MAKICGNCQHRLKMELEEPCKECLKKKPPLSKWEPLFKRNVLRPILLTFDFIQTICKWCNYGYGDDRIILTTCRHSANILPGTNWGNCNQDECPLLKNHQENYVAEIALNEEE